MSKNEWIATIVGVVFVLGFFGYVIVWGSKGPKADDINNNVDKNIASTSVEEITATTTHATTSAQMETTNPLEGFKIVDNVVGTGVEATVGKKVTVNYTGKFTDGKVFDSSIPRGTPFDFTLGSGQVIKGWDLGVLGMKVGGKRTLTIPSSLGYGPNGTGPIPGGATLIFDVELLGVK